MPAAHPCCATPTVAGVCNSASSRKVDFDNDYKTLDLKHGVGDLGLQTVVGQGPGLRGLPGAAVLLARRNSMSNHELRMDDDVTKPPRSAVTVGQGIGWPTGQQARQVPY